MKRQLLRWTTVALLWMALAALGIRNSFPAFPSPLPLELRLNPGQPGRWEPLIVTGITGAGDFLSARYVDENTIVFCYDSWGIPGLVSTHPVRLTPGAPLALRVELPSLNEVRQGFTTQTHRLRVVCDGVTVLEAEPHFFVRGNQQIFFGENPLGGTACGPQLHGQLIREDGRPLRGGPEQFFSLRQRSVGWLLHARWQMLVLLVVAFIAVRAGERFLRQPPADRARAFARWRDAAISHRWLIGVTGLSALSFGWMITDGAFSFQAAEPLGAFYDYQAESLLQGRLDVPAQAISGEAFIVGDKFYGYFGLTPALLRLPLMVFDGAFGDLSRGYMLVYFVAALIACHLILREATGVVAGQPARPSAWAGVLFLGSAGMGSTLYFLGSRAFVFHEAILCGAMLALFSCWCALRHLAAPTRRWWIGAFVCGVLSAHARPPTGLFALTFLGCVVIVIAIRERQQEPVATRAFLPRHFRKYLGLAVLCAAGMLSLNAVAWLKFRTFEITPLRLSQPYNAERLAHIEGKSFFLSNVPFTFYSYILDPNFKFTAHFPYVYMGSEKPRPDFPNAKMDLPDGTLAVPYAMPALFLLATAGCAGAVIALRPARPPVVALWAAVVPMALFLFAAIATAHRYTGDFCPFLICAAAFGLAAVERASPGWRAALRGLLAFLTVGGVLATFAFTLHYEREVLWGVPEAARKNYQEFRRRFDALVEASLR